MNCNPLHQTHLLWFSVVAPSMKATCRSTPSMELSSGEAHSSRSKWRISTTTRIRISNATDTKFNRKPAHRCLWMLTTVISYITFIHAPTNIPMLHFSTGVASHVTFMNARLFMFMLSNVNVGYRTCLLKFSSWHWNIIWNLASFPPPQQEVTSVS